MCEIKFLSRMMLQVYDHWAYLIVFWSGFWKPLKHFGILEAISIYLEKFIPCKMLPHKNLKTTV